MTWESMNITAADRARFSSPDWLQGTNWSTAMLGSGSLGAPLASWSAPANLATAAAAARSSEPSPASTTNALARLTQQVNTLLAGARMPSASATANTAASTASNQAAQNIDRIEGAIPGLTSTTRATGQQIDEYLKNFTYKMLDQFAPGWQGALGAATAAPQQTAQFAQQFLAQVTPIMTNNLMTMGSTATTQANKMMRGEIPTDVLQQIRRGSAERAVAGTGISGDAPGGTMARNLVARDLGLTSVDIMGKGQAMAGTAGSLYQLLQQAGASTQGMLGLPAQVGLQATQAIKNLLPESTANQWMNMISNLTGSLARAGTVDPTSVAQLYTQAASQEAEYDWIKRLSMANMLTGSSMMGMGASQGSGLFGGIF